MDFTRRQICGASVWCEEQVVGVVRDLLFAMNDWSIQYLVVETGAWPSPRRVLVEPAYVSTFDLKTRSLAVSLSCDQLHRCPPEATRPPASQQYAIKIAGPAPAYLHWADSPSEVDAVEESVSLESVQGILAYTLVGWNVSQERIADIRLRTPSDHFCPDVVAIVACKGCIRRSCRDIPTGVADSHTGATALSNSPHHVVSAVAQEWKLRVPPDCENPATG